VFLHKMQSFSVELGVSRARSKRMGLNIRFFQVGDVSTFAITSVSSYSENTKRFFLGFGSRVGICFWFHKDATSLTYEYSETVIHRD